MSEPRTKQQILDDLEQQTMIVAGELAIVKTGYRPRVSMIEDCLGKIINGILELKKIEGIPSNLSIVEGDINEH
jgi:hypothetical protein